MHFNVLDKYMHKAYDWLYDIDDQLGYNNLKCSLAILRVTLHELRDHLPVNEAIYFSAQLPVLIRGLYFEGWNLSAVPIKERSQEEFLASIQRHLIGNYPDIEPKEAVKAVFSTLSYKLDPNEILKICKILPKGIRELFNQYRFVF